MNEEFPFQKAHDAIVSMLHDYLAEKEHAERLESENAILMRRTALLKAEVERLTKAGDGLYKSMLEIGCNEMADNFQYDAWRDSMKDWNAAKEGKGQP
jgi:hypothetical protein